MRALVELVHRGNTLEAAKDIGLSQSTLYPITRGLVQHPRADVIAKIAALYGGDLNWWLTGKGESPPAFVPSGAPGVTVWGFPGGRVLWLKLLRELGITEDTDATTWNIWQTVPGQTMGGALPMFVSDAGVTDPALLRAAADKLTPSVDESYRSWEQWIRALVEVFGPEAVSERIRRLTAEASLGFNRAAIALAKGEASADALDLRFTAPAPPFQIADLKLEGQRSGSVSVTTYSTFKESDRERPGRRRRRKRA